MRACEVVQWLRQPLFCRYDRTPRPNASDRRRKGLPRSTVPEGWESATVGMVGTVGKQANKWQALQWGQDGGAHVPNHSTKQRKQTRSREDRLECKGVCLFVFVVFILQQGWSTYTSPNNAANWGSSIEMPKTMEDIPYSNHTAKVLAPSLISSVRSPEPRQENTEPCRLPSDLHCMPTYIHTHTHNCKTKL